MPEDYNLHLRLALLQHEADEEAERQARIVKARDLYAGALDDDMADELADALMAGDAADLPGLLNIYAAAVDERLNRLSVDTLSADPTGEAGTLEWADILWQRLGLDELQHDLHEYALVDGEAFLFLDVRQNPAGAVEIDAIPHRRYTDPQVDGDGDGMKAHYPNGVKTLRSISFSKRWTEDYFDDRGRRQTRRRMTVYVRQDEAGPARIEKYVFNSGWQPFETPGEAWPLVWADNSGASLPLPIVHFRNPGTIGQEGRPMQGPQIILDSLVTALVSATSSTALPPMVVLGGYPTTDGQPPAEDASNVWQITPRAVIGIPDKTPGEVSIEFMRPPDLGQMRTGITDWITWAATTTGTSGLLQQNIGGSAIAAETISRLDSRPVMRAQRQQTALGNAWSRVFATYVTLAERFGVADLPPGASADETVHVIWRKPDGEGGDDDALLPPLGGI